MESSAGEGAVKVFAYPNSTYSEEPLPINTITVVESLKRNLKPNFGDVNAFFGTVQIK